MFLFILFLTSLNLKSEEVKIIKAKEIWTINDTGPKPFLSSDGSYVAWTKSTKEDRLNDKIYIAKVGTEERTEIGRTKELFGWLDNEYLITEEGFLSIRTKKIASFVKESPNRCINTTTFSHSFFRNVPYYTGILCPLLVIQNGKLKKHFSTDEPYFWSLFIIPDKGKKKLIILMQGLPIYERENIENIFQFATSPDGKKLLVDYFPRETIVINPKEEKICSLPDGTSFSWYPDSKELIFTRLEDDGHFETKGELFICNWDGTNVRKIVFEKERIRREPSFGPPDVITYSFWNENRNLCIGVAKILREH